MHEIPTYDPPSSPLSARSYPQLAQALRSCIPSLLREWQEQVRKNVGPASRVSNDEIVDNLPGILGGMANALGSDDPSEVKRLMERSPEQGIHRFNLHYDTWDLATEDRMLRHLIVEHVAATLRRRLTVEEDAALHWAIDLMAQQAMVAFVKYQNNQLRQAAEAELKYLSFLSYDLSGNLSSVTLHLQILRHQLRDSPQFASQLASLDLAQQAILDTMGGMGKLLQAERLRHDQAEPAAAPLDLRQVLAEVASQFTLRAEGKGVHIAVEVPPDTTVTSNADLLKLILQNLLSNAVKYSTHGTVRVRGALENTQTHAQTHAWTVSVSDEGPGIGPEHLGKIFEAFRRGEMHGQHGVGLGLTIASRAASLLRAKLTVQSTLGQGATFTLRWPERSES